MKALGSARYLFMAAVLVVLASVISASCREYGMRSHWRDRVIEVDGEASDWRGLLSYIEDGEISVGAVNDGEHLYFCLAFESRLRLMQVLSGGMTIWLDSTGRRRKSLGIRFPLGLPERPESSGSAGLDPADREERIEFLRSRMSECELIDQNGIRTRRMKLDEIKGLELGFGRQGETLVYEMKVPLTAAEASPLAAGTMPGGSLSLGLEIPRLEFRLPRRMPAGGSGRIPPAGGGMGGMGGGMGRPGPSSPARDGLKIWIAIELSNPGQ